MEETDALSLVEQNIDHQKHCLNVDEATDNELELLMIDFTNCQLELEIKESVYQRTLANLSTQLKASEAERDKYMEECKKYHVFISMLESEYELVIHQLVDSVNELKYLKEKKLRLKSELTEAEEPKVLALRKAELTERALHVEKEHNKELQETINQSNKQLEQMKMELDMMKEIENELLEKTISTDYYKLELIQAKESFCTKKELMQSVISDERNYSMLIEAEAKQLEGDLKRARAKVSDLCCQVDLLTFESKEREMKQEAEISKLELKNRREVEILKEELDVASAEISYLKFDLGESVRRAEMAEKAKSATEEQMTKWKEEQEQRRASSEAFDGRPSNKNIGDEKGIAYKHRSTTSSQGKFYNYVPLGKFLNMKY